MQEILLILKMDLRKSFSSLPLLISSSFVVLVCILTKSYAVSPSIVMFMLVTICYTYDTSTGYARLIQSLPVKKSSAVIARYLHSLIFLGFILIISILSYSPRMANFYPFTIPYLMFIMVAYISVIIPFCLNESKFTSIVVVIGYLLTLWLTSLSELFCEFLGIDNLAVVTDMSTSTSAILSLILLLISLMFSLILFEKHIPKEGVLE